MDINLQKEEFSYAYVYYILAVKAYQERIPVACTGDLQKIDGVFVLENVRDFQVEQV